MGRYSAKKEICYLDKSSFGFLYFPYLYYCNTLHSSSCALFYF